MLHWLTLHGVVRAIASYGARRGDPQGRLISDPVVKADPVPFYEELRAGGPLVRGGISYVTADYGVAHDVLRSDDFRVMALGSGLPAPLRWLERRVRDPLLHPLRPPSLLAVEPPEHTRYRKTVSSVFTPRAVAALRDRVEQTAAVLLDRRRAGCRRHRRPVLRAASGRYHQRHPGRARRRPRPHPGIR
jgi:cytochrome P450